MSEPLVIVGNGMAAARLVDELTAPLRLNVPSMVPAAAAALLHRTEREDRMNTLMVSTPATGHINPLLGVARVLIAEGHKSSACREAPFAIASKARAPDSAPSRRPRISI